MTNEARMRKEMKTTKQRSYLKRSIADGDFSGFGFRHSFVIRHSSFVILASLPLVCLLFMLQGCRIEQGTPSTAAGSTGSKTLAQEDDAGSRAAFLAAYPVFMHPRCLNCHPRGDAPLQGEDSHI